MDNKVMENDRARIFLQPIASPWVLGLYGFSIAAFVIGGQYAGWFSSVGANALMYTSFAALLGGFTQLLASMWSFKARDVLGTAFNGIWGTFWLAIGFMNLMVSQTAAAGAAPMAATIGGFEFGFFYIPMALITAACAAASIYHSRALLASLVVLTGACILMAIGRLGAGTGIQMVGGWLFAFSTAFAWYSATVSLVANSYARAEKHARMTAKDLNEGLGEPGVIHDTGAKTPAGLRVLRRTGTQAR
ncbi:MAG: GPR1/FUN34/YaaH family transporter [Deltaproteobacteria bacterium]|jgi:succinate-acetate transporter protein